MKDYRTVSKPVITETEIKKSVFVTHLFYIETENDAAHIIDDLSKKHYKAAHVCYAYILGGAADIKKKFSDAGEPQGTAGRPILSVLERRCLENILCVVVRYFGGIKLGAAGLTRAYAASAESAVNASDIVVKRCCMHVEITCGYALAEKIRSFLQLRECVCGDAVFTDTVRLAAYLPLAECDALLSELAELSGARAVCDKKECLYIG
jgi:uncharacterized YigZ family protein